MIHTDSAGSALWSKVRLNLIAPYFLAGHSEAAPADLGNAMPVELLGDPGQGTVVRARIKVTDNTFHGSQRDPKRRSQV